MTDRKLLAEALPASVLEADKLPLGYYLADGRLAFKASFRVAGSTAYRTQAINCNPFYKPISRNLKAEDEP